MFKAGLLRMTKSYELRDCVYNSEVHIHHSKNIAWSLTYKKSLLLDTKFCSADLVALKRDNISLFHLLSSV